MRYDGTQHTLCKQNCGDKTNKLACANQSINLFIYLFFLFFYYFFSYRQHRYGTRKFDFILIEYKEFPLVLFITGQISIEKNIHHKINGNESLPQESFHVRSIKTYKYSLVISVFI